MSVGEWHPTAELASNPGVGSSQLTGLIHEQSQQLAAPRKGPIVDSLAGSDNHPSETGVVFLIDGDVQTFEDLELLGRHESPGGQSLQSLGRPENIVLSGAGCPKESMEESTGGTDIVHEFFGLARKASIGISLAGSGQEHVKIIEATLNGSGNGVDTLPKSVGLVDKKGQNKGGQCHLVGPHFSNQI